MYKTGKRLPPMNEKVLMYNAKKKEWVIDERVESIGGGWAYFQSYRDHITHWCKLPKNPEET